MNRLLMINLFSVMLASSAAFGQTTETKSFMGSLIDADQLKDKLIENGGQITIPPGQSMALKSTSGVVTKYSADKSTVVFRLKQPDGEITSSALSTSNDRQQRIEEHQERIRTILTERAARTKGTTNTSPALRDAQSTEGLSERDKRVLEHQERIRQILRQSQQRRAAERAPAKESQ